MPCPGCPAGSLLARRNCGLCDGIRWTGPRAEARQPIDRRYSSAPCVRLQPYIHESTRNRMLLVFLTSTGHGTRQRLALIHNVDMPRRSAAMAASLRFSQLPLIRQRLSQSVQDGEHHPSSKRVRLLGSPH
jgi:hypothetical protein